MATQSPPTPLCCAHAAGRGDLVRLLNLAVPIPREHAAALLGFALVDQEAEQEHPSAGASIPLDARGVDAAKGETKSEAATTGAPSLWRAIGPDLREPDPSERELPDCLKDATPRTGEALAARSHKTILPAPLAPASRLAAVLRRLVTIETPGRRLDEPKLVRRLAHLRPLLRLPCKPRRGWTPRLQVYWDQAQALGTCWHDQEAVIRWLRRWRGPQGLEMVVVDDEGRARWHPHTKRGQAPQPTRPVRPADSGTTLLALSDLGFAQGDLARQAIWAGFHRRATRSGAHGRAMVLCPRHRWDSRQVARWHGVDWERPRGRPAVVAPSAASPLEALFVLLSPAIRIETGLLRALRRLAARRHPGMDLGVEIDAWMDSRAVFRDSALGMVLDPKQVHAARKIFRDRPEVERLEVADLLADFHGELAPDILAEEHRACGTHGDEPDKVMAGHARGLWDADANVETVVGAEAAYFERWESRQAPADWQNNANATLWALVNRKADGTDFVRTPPEGLDEGRLLWALPHIAQPTWWRLWQRGRALHLLPRSEAPLHGMSLLTEILLRLPRVTLVWRDGGQTADLAGGAAVDLPLANDQATTLEVMGDLGNASVLLAPHPPWADRFWRDGSGLWVETTVRGFEWRVEEGKRSLFGGKKPTLTIAPQDLTTRLLWPTWATRLEKDEHGLYAEVDLAEKVVTRLRWIPPGKFLMGSPEDEKGRVDREGPQHWVTLRKGYWLADAPCTQAEWQAVMGTEPSYFKGEKLPKDERLKLPVEQVSWDDCQAFCERLRARFPGLEARLPSEAEWEYACRAGTASAFNDGSACTEPQGKDPALAKLGWFDGNSENRTHTVRELKNPNQWGLHDMHGNVWEWCQDWLGDYAADDQQDPTGADSGRGRVGRGGSWFYWAWNCRSAFRGGWQPVDRVRLLGFRLASGQSSQESKPSEERAAGKQAGRRPPLPGGERAGKQAKGRK